MVIFPRIFREDTVKPLLADRAKSDNRRMFMIPDILSLYSFCCMNRWLIRFFKSAVISSFLVAFLYRLCCDSMHVFRFQATFQIKVPFRNFIAGVKRTSIFFHHRPAAISRKQSLPWHEFHCRMVIRLFLVSRVQFSFAKWHLVPDIQCSYHPIKPIATKSLPWILRVACRSAFIGWL